MPVALIHVDHEVRAGPADNFFTHPRGFFRFGLGGTGLRRFAGRGDTNSDGRGCGGYGGAFKNARRSMCLLLMTVLLW